MLYKHHGFRERVLALRGTGRVEHEPDFDALAKGGAVALTRLPNGHYLCGVWSDSDRAKPPRLELYLSEAPVFDGRFRQQPGAVRT